MVHKERTESYHSHPELLLKQQLSLKEASWDDRQLQSQKICTKPLPLCPRNLR